MKRLTKTRVHPLADDSQVHDDHLGTPPKASTSTDARDPHPRDETPVDAGEGNGQEKRVEEKVKKKKKLWQRINSFFRGLKKRRKSKSGQGEVQGEQQQPQQSEAVEPQNELQATCSHDHIISGHKLTADDNHPSTPPKPSTSTAEQDPHPHSEAPVDAGVGNGQENRVTEEKVEEKKKSSNVQQSWWKWFVSFFIAPQSSSSGVEQQKNGAVKPNKKWRAKSSDAYIFSHYEVGKEIGRGGFGVVYEGRRLKDDCKVALKYVNKIRSERTLLVPGYRKYLPAEIALTIMANTGPRVPEIIQLLDWKDYHDHFVMILERPPCENLVTFVGKQGGSLTESLARTIMRQVVKAALVCCQRSVFHRDIKLSNLLINKETLEVKLIDFGCGDILKTGYYRACYGTELYFPPELQLRRKYLGKPATVWTLGILLFRIVLGHYPNFLDLQMIRNWSVASLSSDLCQLLCALLQQKPHRRIDLEKILSHKWFMVDE